MKSQQYHSKESLIVKNFIVLFRTAFFCKLKNSGIVKSQRGPGGGYKLGRNAQDITLLQIITAVEENIDQTQCGGSLNCNKEKTMFYTSRLDWFKQNYL